MKRKSNRNIRIILTALLFAIVLSGTASAASLKQQALQAYSNFLEKNASRTTSFGILYLDKDSVPELCCNYSYKGYRLYTWRDGKMIQIKSDSYAVYKYYKKTGVAMLFYAHGSAYNGLIEWSYYYKLKNDALVYKGSKSKFTDLKGKVTYAYEWKSKTVKKAKFKKALKKLSKSKKAKKVKYYSNTAENRASYLK